MKVHIDNTNFPDIAIREIFLYTLYQSICEREGKVLKQVDIIFLSDEELLEINNNFLQHNYYTDIITFDNSFRNNIEGELYISIDRIRDNAQQIQTSFDTELLRVLIHGVLHLVGYTDATPDQKSVMRAKEDTYILLAKNME